MNTLLKRLQAAETFSHIVSMKYMPRWVLLLVDMLLCSTAFLLACLFNISVQTIHVWTPIWFFTRWGVVMAIQLCAFWIFHTYAGVLRYSGYIDAVKLLLAEVLSLLLLLLLQGSYLLIYKEEGFFPNILFLCVYVLVAYLLLFGLRLMVKETFDYLNLSTKSRTRVMVYGVRSIGVAIAKTLRSSNNENYKVVGFIADGLNETNKEILGLKVYRRDEKLLQTMQQLQVKTIIISPLKQHELDMSVNLDEFLNNGIKVLVAPQIQAMESAEHDESQMAALKIRSMQIEDVLERPTIQVNLDNVRRQLDKRVVLITGAAGSIGSEIARQIAKLSPSLLVLVDQAESPLHNFRLELEHSFPHLNFTACVADVRNGKRMDQIVETFRPDIIYHAAAYKHVPLMEDYPNESVQANVLGTRNMADLAVKYGVKRFVMISTDKAVNPTNIMGASKRIAEMYVQSLFRKLHQENPDCTKFITTRFGNVLGSNGSVIPYFKKQIEEGGPVTVTHPDIIRYFMTIPEACWLVLEAGCMGSGGEIFVFDMGTPIKILDLAKKMIRLAGFEPGKDIQIEFTGLRPGEKLYEELLNNKEITIPTDNPKIMVAKVRETDYEQVSTAIDDLIQYSYQGKDFLTVAQMKKIVPEYISKNSPFEKLDV